MEGSHPHAALEQKILHECLCLRLLRSYRMNVLEILAAEVGEVPSLLHSHLAGIQNNMKESESDPTSTAIIESKLTTQYLPKETYIWLGK